MIENLWIPVFTGMRKGTKVPVLRYAQDDKVPKCRSFDRFMCYFASPKNCT
jgi:hypothetical protein